jgi:hypothetical protein
MPGEGPRAGMNVIEIRAEIRSKGVALRQNIITVEKHLISSAA